MLKDKYKTKIDTTKGLTNAEKERRFERYFGPPDMKIKNKINNFINKLNKKEVGSLTERGNFVIKKSGPNEYDINYYNMSPLGYAIMANFRSGDLASLARILYEIDMGIIDWKDGVPLYINNI